VEILLVVITFIATVIGAISGIGGGVLIKPVMDALVDYPVATISFLSGNTVLAMTAVSLLRSRKDSIKVDSVVGTPLAIGGAFGGVFGKLIFSAIQQAYQNDALLGLVQNILMVLLTVTVFFYVLNKSKIKTLSVRNKVLALAAGLVFRAFFLFSGNRGRADQHHVPFLPVLHGQQACCTQLVVHYLLQPGRQSYCQYSSRLHSVVRCTASCLHDGKRHCRGDGRAVGNQEAGQHPSGQALHGTDGGNHPALAE